MEEKEIRDKIKSVVESHTKGIWTTPYFEQRYIPNEEIWKLKEDLFEMVKDILTKGGQSRGKAKKS